MLFSLLNSAADRRLCLRTSCSGWFLKPDNADSQVELLNPQNLSYFSCFFPSIYISGELSCSLYPTVFALLTVIPFCSPLRAALSEVLVLGEFLRGIFPCFKLLVWPLKQPTATEATVLVYRQVRNKNFILDTVVQKATTTNNHMKVIILDVCGTD